MKTEVVDLSQILNKDTPAYPGDTCFSSCPHLTFSEHGVRVQKISIGTHTGTHIDVPSHFIDEGKTVEQVSLSWLVGPAVVIDLTQTGRDKDLQKRETIGLDDLKPYESRIKRYIDSGETPIVLLRTGWSKYWATEDYIPHPFVAPHAAQWLVDVGVRVLGIDTFSPDETVVDSSDFVTAVHKIVLGAGAVIVENLTNLAAIQEGEWVVSVVPLKLEGADGSPIRACAWRKE
ncbi:putative cyclase [Irpex rosettiformis]|uniref:Cyclase n=1 Tax=Irpex rosettiformis TaxID=378272 RepID=A0ACB8TYK5_9APHY|nr:putative cyclase [Irpex rosettiformis]